MAGTPTPPESDADEATVADEEWPVAEQYRLEPPARLNADDDRTIVIQHDSVAEPVRRFPPDVGRGLLAALLGVLLIVALVPAGIWLAGRDDDEPDATATSDPFETTSASTTQTTDTRPAPRTVPELTGLIFEEARALLEPTEVSFVRVYRLQSNAPAGEVVEQTPPPGTRIASDTVVVLTVVPERVTVPSVEGLLISEAASLLRQAGLGFELETVRSSEPEGRVVRQDPRASEEVAPRTIVLLEVAGSPAPVTIEVPRLVGLPAAQARSRLQALGLRSTQRPAASTQSKGTVVRQSPGAGTKLREGQAVLLTVSTGPAQVPVPDVVGLDEEPARRELEAAGFEVQVVDEPTEGVEEDGLVLAQDPVGGTSRPKGSVVTITVSRFG